LIGYNETYSDSIINFLDKAISLNPDYRETYYWFHAEYGARAGNAIEDFKIKECKQAYETAMAKGAMPKWVLEFARNTLNSCDSNAILFTQGDITLNPISYCRL